MIKNKLKDFKEKIKEKEDIGTLKEVSPEELQELLKMEHHFTYLGVVSNEQSGSTPTRLINNTLSYVAMKALVFPLKRR